MSDDDDLDLDLLRKLASGEGGRRTGALKRAGLLEWRVTDAGRAALGDGSTMTDLERRLRELQDDIDWIALDQGASILPVLREAAWIGAALERDACAARLESLAEAVDCELADGRQWALALGAAAIACLVGEKGVDRVLAKMRRGARGKDRP